MGWTTGRTSTTGRPSRLSSGSSGPQRSPPTLPPSFSQCFSWDFGLAPCSQWTSLTSTTSTSGRRSAEAGLHCCRCHHHPPALPRGCRHPQAAEEECEGGSDGGPKSERGVDAGHAAEESQQRLRAYHQVRLGIQNHQQAPRLDEHSVIIELIIVVLNNILSRLKIIIDIIISKRLSIDPRSSLKRCTK